MVFVVVGLDVVAEFDVVVVVVVLIGGFTGVAYGSAYTFLFAFAATFWALAMTLPSALDTLFLYTSISWLS